MWTRIWPRASAAVALSTALSGCASRSLPDPKLAVARYERALKNNDSKALYGMLTREGQQELGEGGVKRALKDGRGDLLAQAQKLRKSEAEVRERAMVRFDDGEEVALAFEDGRFRLQTADALPAQTQTPQAALRALRLALVRRSYASLLQVLTPASARAMEQDLTAIGKGLEEPRTLEIDQTGDRATVKLPSGHWVKLRRQAGVWKVVDFR